MTDILGNFPRNKASNKARNPNYFCQRSLCQSVDKVFDDRNPRVVSQEQGQEQGQGPKLISVNEVYVKALTKFLMTEICLTKKQKYGHLLLSNESKSELWW